MAKFKVGDEVWIIRKDLPVQRRITKIEEWLGRPYFTLVGDKCLWVGHREESIFPSREAAVEESHARLTAEIAALQKRREDLRNS